MHIKYNVNVPTFICLSLRNKPLTRNMFGFHFDCLFLYFSHYFVDLCGFCSNNYLSFIVFLILFFVSQRTFKKSKTKLTNKKLKKKYT